MANDCEKLEWVRNDNGTFLMPAKKPSRINSFRRWEQAFHIYTTIYCGKNPTRAREIWQYISVINTAASSFVWENVYNYDIIFRQLMQYNPNRSWAITYSHMWNLSMRTPLPQRSSGHSFNASGGGGFSQPGFAGKSQQNPLNHQQRKRKSNYCWSFNKGMKCKFGSKCKFIERCSYCDAASHGVHNCPKLAGKDILKDAVVASKSVEKDKN